MANPATAWPGYIQPPPSVWSWIRRPPVSLLRSGPTTNELTLDWSTEPVTAVPGRDYVSSRGTVQFAIKSRIASITVPVIDNLLPDRDRTVRLRFTSPTGGPVPPPTGFAIANDDPGFPPDGIRLLSDGQLLLRPTGWLEKRDGVWGIGLEGGSLEELRSGNPSYQSFRFMDPYPEFITNPENSSDGQSIFFRVRSYP
jgi:hypothetical protein